MQKIINIFEKNKVLKILVNRELFILVAIVSNILWSFPVLQILINPICKIYIIWGALLIGYDLLGKRLFFKTPYWYWITMLLGMYCITIVCNIQTSFYMGVKHLMYTAISLMVIFVQCGQINAEEQKNMLKKVNNAVISIATIANFLSLIMYCFHVAFSFEYDGLVFRQGFLENRLFGLYTSPNVGALFSVICIAAILINNYLSTGSLSKLRKRYILCFVIQIIYFSLTLSNGGFVTVSVFLILLICAFFFNKVKEKKGILLSVFLAVLTMGVTIVGLDITVKGIRLAMSAVPSTIQYISNELKEENKENKEKETIEEITFERIESGDDASNGRLTIWSGGLKIWAQSPVFGIADARIDENNIDGFAYSIDNLTDAEMERQLAINGNYHNAYIQILVYSGLAGLSCFLILIILSVKRYIQYLFVEDVNSKSYKIIGVLFCILGAIGANGMVENHLLFNRQDPFGLLFWF